MLVFRSIQEAHGSLDRCAVAIGNFDGVHLGHRRLIDTARALAKASGHRSAVLTFEPHAAKVLSPTFAPPLIATLPRKLELLRETGIDAVVLQPFDRAYAGTSPQHFVNDDLIGGLQAADVVVGDDFTFGKGRAGNVGVLAQLAGDRLRLHTVPPVMADGLIVSSSKIRELVLDGRVGPAARLLGRPFIVDGAVVPGRGRGRTIGVPTANVAPSTELGPGNGVYAVQIAIEGDDALYAGAANIGVKPTFGTEERTIEVHILDFVGDIYGKRVAVAFLERLRGELRFASVDELVAKIAEDIARAREKIARGGIEMLSTPKSNS